MSFNEAKRWWPHTQLSIPHLPAAGELPIRYVVAPVEEGLLADPSTDGASVTVYWESASHPLKDHAPQQVLDGGGIRLRATFVPPGGIAYSVDYRRIPSRSVLMVEGEKVTVTNLSLDAGHGRTMRNITWVEEVGEGDVHWEFDGHPNTLSEQESLDFVRSLVAP